MVNKSSISKCILPPTYAYNKIYTALQAFWRVHSVYYPTTYKSVLNYIYISLYAVCAKIYNKLIINIDTYPLHSIIIL